MFPKLYSFVCDIRERAKTNERLTLDERLTLVQMRDAQFSTMSRESLLTLRASCYSLAEEITAYVTWQDSRDIDHDEI